MLYIIAIALIFWYNFIRKYFLIGGYNMKLKLQIIFKTITIISILLISIFLLQKISFGSEQTEQTKEVSMNEL